MKRTVPMLFGGLGLLAAVCAGGLNAGIAIFAALPDGAEVSEAGPSTVASADTPRPTPAPRALTKRQYIEGILDRNIFDHEAIGKTGSGGGADAITDLAVTLLGTLVSSNVDFSVATIVGSDKDAFPGTFGIGDKLQDATIIAIEQGKVKIRRGTGAEEYLVVSDEGPKPTRTSGGGGEAGNEDDQISKDGENQFTVDKDLVDRYLSDLDALGRMGRAIPHRGPDGQIDGYRLSGIRRNSLGEKLGIRNGDIVHAVNGQGLTSMQGAMSAYSSLQSESNFSFEVTRRGQKMTLQYEVR
ncbi:MAG: hypothetical protein EP330_25460 [Deltaproteobacteria bacterium]|nr:MAG: hypothetical protein EP330_25460 [Deltaproteobacteria bacterium]